MNARWPVVIWYHLRPRGRSCAAKLRTCSRWYLLLCDWYGPLLLFFLGHFLSTFLNSLPLSELLWVLGCSCTILLALLLGFLPLYLLLSASFFLLCSSFALHLSFLLKLPLSLFFILLIVSGLQVSKPSSLKRHSLAPSSFQRRAEPLVWKLLP